MPHLLHVFPSFVPAGSQVRTIKLLSAFGDAHHHTIVAMDGRTSAAEKIPDGVDFSLREPPQKAGTLRTVPRMRALLREIAPDLVLTYNFGALDTLFAARTLRFARVVHHEDGFHADEAQTLKRRRVWGRRAAFAGVARVVVISRNLERIARKHWRVRPEKLVFIANGIDVESFEVADRNLELRRQHQIPSDAVIVGSVGHLRPEKNFARLLRAVHSARQASEANLHVVLLGEGPERDALEALARELELEDRVTFAGYQPDPRPWYRMMDVFALTSDTEQAPIALIEAMAAGLPVVATAVGDVTSMVAPETAGRVVAMDTTEAERVSRLASHCTELAANPELRAREAAAQRTRARSDFAAEGMVAHYRALYDDVLTGR